MQLLPHLFFSVIAIALRVVTCMIWTQYFGMHTTECCCFMQTCVDHGCDTITCAWNGGHVYFDGATSNGKLVWGFLSQWVSSCCAHANNPSLGAISVQSREQTTALLTVYEDYVLHICSQVYQAIARWRWFHRGDRPGSAAGVPPVERPRHRWARRRYFFPCTRGTQRHWWAPVCNYAIDVFGA